MNVDGDHPHLVFHALIRVLDGGAGALLETLLVPVILDADLSPMRTAISSLRSKLGDDGKDPTYIFTELRVGYRMPRGEAKEGR